MSFHLLAQGNLGEYDSFAMVKSPQIARALEQGGLVIGEVTYFEMGRQNNLFLIGFTAMKQMEGAVTRSEAVRQGLADLNRLMDRFEGMAPEMVAALAQLNSHQIRAFAEAIPADVLSLVETPKGNGTAETVEAEEEAEEEVEEEAEADVVSEQSQQALSELTETTAEA